MVIKKVCKSPKAAETRGVMKIVDDAAINYSGRYSWSLARLRQEERDKQENGAGVNIIVVMVAGGGQKIKVF